jgi:hypothetical protein
VVGMDMIIGRSLTLLNPSRTYGPSAGVTTTRAGTCRVFEETAPPRKVTMSSDVWPNDVSASDFSRFLRGVIGAHSPLLSRQERRGLSHGAKNHRDVHGV